MKIWYDITNTPQVHFLLAIKDLLDRVGVAQDEPIYTAREFSETAKMLEKRVGKDGFVTIGGHYGKSYIKKVAGLLDRFRQIYKLPFDYDLSISCGSESAIWASWLRGKKSIAFGDNDQARQWTYGHMVDYAFFPNAISRELLEKQGLKHKLYLYNGYKEDLYLANYTPSADFMQTVPFTNYVVVRPENVMANYIRNDQVRSITPDLLRLLASKGYNILYLPRYDMDRAYADGIKNIFIPDGPINGLDACYYADAVLTGAGTFAREAACLGVPSFSFFAGKQLLAVDRQMITNGQMFFSRDAEELIKHLGKSSKVEPNLQRSKNTQNEVGEKLKDLILNWHS